jgi:hypothetical protein
MHNFFPWNKLTQYLFWEISVIRPMGEHSSNLATLIASRINAIFEGSGEP